MPTVIDEFPVAPPLVIKDTPHPRRLTKLEEARAYVDEAMRLGRRSAPWRDLWHRLKSAATEDQAIEAIGAMRELLAEEDLLVPPDVGWPGLGWAKAQSAVPTRFI